MNRLTDRSATAPLFLLLSALGGAAGCADPVGTAAALATDERFVTAIAVDDDFVYWSKKDGAIKRVSIDGGPSETLASGQNEPANLAVDPTHVFWTTGDNLIMAAAKVGGPAVTLVTEPQNIDDLAVDISSIYWSAADGILKKAQKLGASAPEPLAKDLPHLRSLALAGSDIFWTNDASSTLPSAVMRVEIRGGSPSTVVQDDNPAHLAIRAGRMVWSANTVADGGRVSWAALDGTDIRTVWLDTTSDVTAVEADEDNTFWTDSDGTLNRADIDGGEDPVLLVKGPPGVVSIALDRTSVYWANANDSVIMVMPRP